MKKTRKDLIFNVFKYALLLVPMFSYLFYQATTLNIKYDYMIENIEYDEISVYKIDEDKFIVFDTTFGAVYTGEVIYHGEYNIHGLYINSKDIIKINNKYYSYVENEETKQWSFTDIEKIEAQKQAGFKWTVAFFLTLFGSVIVFLVVSNKMLWHKKHPKYAVFISLWTGTGILFIINTVIGGILGVFAVASVSWSMYLLADLKQNGIIKDSKEVNDTLDALKKALNGSGRV